VRRYQRICRQMERAEIAGWVNESDFEQEPI
jgi:hypothetical protein